MAKDSGVPEIPLVFIVKNEALGRVRVTRHAWARFCTRYPVIARITEDRARLTQAFFMSAFEECFKRAEEKPMSGRNTVRRIFDNHLKRVKYFRDPESGIRFVVSDESAAIPSIVTVEEQIFK